MLISARYTNSFTNLLHTIALLVYFVLLLNDYGQRNLLHNEQYFFILVIFFSLFYQKLIGSYIHLLKEGSKFTLYSWQVLYYITPLYCIAIGRIVPIAWFYTIILYLLSGAVLALSIYYRSLLYHALITSICAFVVFPFLNTTAQVSLVLVIMANVLWMVIDFWLWKKLTPEQFYKHAYHHDIYHFMLIGASFLMFDAAIKF